MARWRPLWAKFVRNTDLQPSPFVGYLQVSDRPYLLVPDDFDAKREGFCRLCGLHCYPYTPDECLHLNSRIHVKNVRTSGDVLHLQPPWCDPPGAAQINLVDKSNPAIEAPETPEALLAIEAPEALVGPVPDAPEAMLDVDAPLRV